VTVDGMWDSGSNPADSCVTNFSGLCTVSMNNLKNNVLSVSFTVNNLVKSGMQYEPADNVVGNSVVVGDAPVDLTPTAVNDSYQTEVATALNGNVMVNDNQGDGPAIINNNSSPGHGNLSLGSNGAFTYTPEASYDGPDSFTYSIIDQDGDVSNTATVTIAVNIPEPPPPTGSRIVNAVPYKVKGLQHVDLTWENFGGSNVQISRDTVELVDSPTANDGEHTDNIGVKGGGQTYVYEVCEQGSSNCANTTASF